MDRDHDRSPARRGQRAAREPVRLRPPASPGLHELHRQARSRIEKAPKDGDGRVLSLDLLTCELLRERFQRRRAEAQVLGVQVPEDAFAFSPDPAGRTPWNPDTMTHRYRRYAEGLVLRAR